jgi:hypothetical protein
MKTLLKHLIIAAAAAFVLASASTSAYASGGSGGGGGTVSSATSTITSFTAKSGRSKYGYPWERVDYSWTCNTSKGPILWITVTITNLDNGLSYTTPVFNTLSGSSYLESSSILPYSANVRVDINTYVPITMQPLDSQSITMVLDAPKALTTAG